MERLTFSFVLKTKVSLCLAWQRAPRIKRIVIISGQHIYLIFHLPTYLVVSTLSVLVYVETFLFNASADTHSDGLVYQYI